MAIDKMIPRFLVSDEDERLLKEGAMTDALNVSISEDGDGSEGVVKNVKGTLPATTSSPFVNLDGSKGKVIGSVSDSDRGFIYFFVARDTGAFDNTIYQYNTTDNTYIEVIKNHSGLDFNSESSIKADLINADFKQDGNVSTIIYFTDNVKPPRKINVDRAIAGEYNVGSGRFDEAIQTIKAANNKFPLVSFDTDTSFGQNHLSTESFQFATQNIFKDGEESAISPYSALAVSQSMYLQSMETGNAISMLSENVCLVNTQVDVQLPDLSKVRLLCRRGNDTSFFVVDEFDPSINLTRNFFGTDITVYDASTFVYRFYNNILGATVDPSVVDKMYDNVPLFAQGQALVGNRLFYSNYVEGRDNVPTNVTITPKYSLETDKAENFISVSDYPNVISQTSAVPLNQIKIDLLGGGAFDGLEAQGGADGDTLVPSGTVIDISFRYDTDFTLSLEDSSSASKPVLTFDVTITGLPVPGSNIPAGIAVGQVESDAAVTFSRPANTASDQQTVSVRHVVSQDTAIKNLVSPIDEKISLITKEYNYEINQTLIATVGGGLDDDENVLELPNGLELEAEGNIVVDIRFNETITTSTIQDCNILINPKVENIRLPGGSGDASPRKSNANTPLYIVSTSSESISDCFDSVSSDTQTHSNIDASYVHDAVATAIIKTAKPTFKSGSTHSFGVVYYDKFNRSGFVNELGSCYVNTIPERVFASQGLGPASIEIAFPSISNGGFNPPAWAERYQIVYSGADSISDYVQYTTGPAFYACTQVAQNSNQAHGTDTGNKRVYVSLNNLEDYKTEKGALRDYSFTKGDKLRLISRRSDDNSTTLYERATDGSPIEFEVVGTVIMSHTGSGAPSEPTEPVNINADPSHTDAEFEDKHAGVFLVLESSRINGGEVDSSGAAIRYVGYDWGDVSGFDPSTGTSSVDGSSSINHWGKQTVVEIYTPKKTTSEKVYYEIGEGRSIGSKNPSINAHGASITLTNGDAWFRPVECKTALHHGDSDQTIQVAGFSAWEYRSRYDLYKYKAFFLESNNITDRIESKVWSRGRAHVPFKQASEIRRFNGITYGDEYAEDVANLSLSSFNPSLGNFDSLEPKFGTINYIGNYNDNLVALQDNKLSLILVNKNIIQYAEGSGNVAISTNVLGQAKYSSGDYGCGGHPEAVLIQDNNVFFVDESRQAVMRFSGEQLAPISEKNMSSFFEDFFKAGHTRYVSGYDPRISTYFITGYGGSGADYSAETVGYDVARGVWQSKYSFTPDVYANQNNMLYSAKHTSGNDIFWRHDDDVTPNRNTFYGTAYPSEVEMVSKISPSRVKVYNAISYEGDSSAWTMSTAATTDLGQTSGTITSWSEREGSYYASIPRDTSSNSTSQKMYVGTLSTGALSPNTVLTSTIRLNRLNIPIGVGLYLGDGITLITVLSVSGNSMTVEGVVGQANGQDHIILSDSNGDAIRGHYAKIKLTNNSNAKHELYCINTHITDSKLHHPLSQ